MFSPNETAAPARGGTNSRRRVRAAASEESLSGPGARPAPKRRKRSSLGIDTFVAPGAANGHADKAPQRTGSQKQQHQLANGHNGGALNGVQHEVSSPEEMRSAREGSVEATGHPLGTRSRGSKRSERPRQSGDLGLLHAETDHYSVWKDSDLPAALQSLLGKESWRADLVPNLGYAVALTHTQAIVWPYAHDAGFADGSRTQTIKLPFQNAPSHYSKDPLPLSALVHDTGVGELALLVVLPSTGKLVYWESVTTAAKADTVRQRQQGIHGAVNGLFSSEYVQEIIAAEPDGFLLTTSYGRLVHMSVRDLQGRPRIASTILQSDEEASSGFFGSIRNVFGAGWRKEIVATRAAPVRTKSSRQCVVSDANGIIEKWEFTRHGSKSLQSVVHAKEAIHGAISAVHADKREKQNHFHVADLTFSHRSASESRQHEHHRVMLLCGYTIGQDSSYYVIDAVLQDSSLEVEVVHPASRWPTSTNSSKGHDTKPRLLVPAPEDTAYIIGSECIMLLSLREIEESPDAQLQLESQTLSEPFQDILTLNSKRNYRIIASAIRPRERGSGKATCYLLVDNFGLARAVASPLVESELLTDRRAYLCRSQIEQGVFFGSIADNLLDFSSGIQKGDWTDEEIEANTLAVNDSIVNNKSKRIPPMAPSMERQLKTRSGWLQQLMKYVGKSRLSAAARWHLLWSAEKMAAAEAVWTSYSEFLRSKTLREKLLLPELLDIMVESYKHENNPDLGETDIVRHYLDHDVARIELLVPYAEHALTELHNENTIKQPAQEAKLIHQAIELQTVILRTAFKFRTDNSANYGFPKDSIVDGIYQGDYRGLPYAWTSPLESPRSIQQLLDQAVIFAITANEVSSPVEGKDVDLNVLAMLSASVPGLIELCFRVYEERCRWLEAQDEASQDKAARLREEYQETRQALIVKLISLELEEDGFVLGEHYRDMDALAQLLATSDKLSLAELNNPATGDDEKRMCKARLDRNQDRADRYFETYGDDWAWALYDFEIDSGKASNLLIGPPKYRDYVTRYLQGNEELRKLRWIHEVDMHHYEQGAEVLMEWSRKEDSLWARKINLSMAKLCKLAAQEQKQIDNSSMLKDVHRIERRLAISDIQEQLYAYTQPLLQNAIDQLAAVDLAMDSYGSFVQDKPFLAGQLKAHFEKLVQRHVLDAEELIEMLTIVSPNAQERDETFTRNRFFLALRLLQLTAFEGTRSQLHAELIWRRCLLQDDWTAFNRTEYKTDEAVAAGARDTVFFQTLVAGFTDGLLSQHPPIAPADLLHTGTSSAVLRESAQFQNAGDDLLEALAADCVRESTALEEVNNSSRLEHWWPGVVDGAREAARQQVAANTSQAVEDAASRAELERELDRVSMYDKQDGQGDTVMG